MIAKDPFGMTPDSSHLHQAVVTLCAVEPAFGRVIERYGPPPAWGRPQGFATLMRIILEQQVSLASGKAAFDRLNAAGPVIPSQFLRYSDEALKAIGFSRQKMAYGRSLSEAILDRKLDLQALNRLPDDDVRAELTQIKGIGIWTANIYLLMGMQRPDVWPTGDIALAAAYQELTDRCSRPNADALERISRQWSPWRSTAARLLWHFYLSCKQTS